MSSLKKPGFSLVNFRGENPVFILSFMRKSLSKYLWLLPFGLYLLLPGQWGSGSVAADLLYSDNSVRFVENVGQWDNGVGDNGVEDNGVGDNGVVSNGVGNNADLFQATTRDGTLWISRDGLWLSKVVPEQGQINIRLSFEGQNPAARLEPFDRQAAVVSYFRGDDPDNWHGAVPVWGGVRIRNLYPGMDLVLSGRKGEVIPEFVGSGAGGQIKMEVEGAEAVTVDGRQIQFATPAGSIVWPLPASETPLTLNISDQATAALDSQQLTPAWQPEGMAGGSPLIFGTFIGGLDVLPDVPNATAVDGEGNIYTTGYTESTVFPSEPGLSPQHGIDVIITKLLADGSDLAYAIHINPSAFNQPDYGYGILVNDLGEAYVVGETNSFDFPITPGAMDPTFGEGDVFFLKVAADGASLLYSTFLGGSDLDGARGFARDGQGNFYLTGQTWSADYPVTTCLNSPPAPCHKGVRDAFITKLNPSGTAVLYSTMLGGDVQEQAQAIVVSSTGEATITGWTNSSNYPTTDGAYDESYNEQFDAFVTKVNAAGTAVIYSTFLGGDNEDRANALMLHDNGRVTLTGVTLCPCTTPFPTTPGAYDTSHNGGYDVFVAELTGNGSGLNFSTFLGGAAEERGYGLSLTTVGSIAVTGVTYSAAFPMTPDAFDDSLGGGRDAFLSILNSSAEQLNYSTFLGGSEEDEGSQVISGPQGELILAGSTRSADFPVTPGAYNTTLNGDYDIFIVNLDFGFGPPPPAEQLVFLPLVVNP